MIAEGSTRAAEEDTGSSGEAIKKNLMQDQKEMVELRALYDMRRTAVHLQNPTLKTGTE